MRIAKPTLVALDVNVQPLSSYYTPSPYQGQRMFVDRDFGRMHWGAIRSTRSVATGFLTGSGFLGGGGKKRLAEFLRVHQRLKRNHVGLWRRRFSLADAEQRGHQISVGNVEMRLDLLLVERVYPVS